jgi:hypothetical protein
MVGFSKIDRRFLAIKPVLASTSEHAENDCRKESEGDDGGKHVEPHPQFHLGFLCGNEPNTPAPVGRRQCMESTEAWSGRQEKSPAAVH